MAIQLRGLFVKARSRIGRVGWFDAAGIGLFVVGLGLLFIAKPQLEGRLVAQQTSLRAAQSLASHRDRQSQSLPARLPLVQQNLQNFYAVLGDVQTAERSLTTMFGEADKQELELEQAEYRLSYDKGGRFYAYSIKLPVSGSYVALRSFCENLLLALPYASLDDVSFKRHNASDASLDAKLHFTLYLNGPDGYAVGIAESASKQDAAP